MKIAVLFDIDGVIRDVSQSYRRALADTVEEFTRQLLPQPWRPSMADIDDLKSEGQWNNDWEGSRELVYRAWERQGRNRQALTLDFDALVQYFQSRYRGQGDSFDQWDGYICDEPLLVDAHYFEQLSERAIGWGFFSGATRGSATFILTRRLGLQSPPLYAMEDGPEKPDPTGMFRVLERLECDRGCTYDVAIYCGDTVSDMKTLLAARQQQPQRQWHGIGILPPHLWADGDRQSAYRDRLQASGADLVLTRVTEVTPLCLQQLI
jgi:HAD superfamily phosphatase